MADGFWWTAQPGSVSGPGRYDLGCLQATQSSRSQVYYSSNISLLAGPREGEYLMFVVLLRFSEDKKRAPELMDGHNAWLRSGFDDGVFVLAGSLQPGMGGGIVAHDTSLEDLQTRVNEDPFVVAQVVSAEILEIAVAKTDSRLDFLRS